MLCSQGNQVALRCRHQCRASSHHVTADPSPLLISCQPAQVMPRTPFAAACSQVCHAGKCGACKLAGPKACPCGKTQLPEAACDVVVPPCGETCEADPCCLRFCIA